MNDDLCLCGHTVENHDNNSNCRICSCDGFKTDWEEMKRRTEQAESFRKQRE